MARKRTAIESDEVVYFVQRNNCGVARVHAAEIKLLSLYRNAKGWAEVSRETYLQHRFRLCLV